MPITHGPVRPLPGTRESDKPITFETVYGPEHKVDFGGSPVSGLTWLEDGEHYLQARDGRLYKVHAASGRSVLFVDPNKLAEGLKRLPAMRKKRCGVDIQTHIVSDGPRPHGRSPGL